MRRAWVLKGVGVVAATGVGAYAGARWAAARARRREDPYAGREFEPPFDVERRVETADGSRLHILERGAGVPVVLAHGVTNDHRTWFHQIEDLPDHGIRAIAFDQRGHGRSTVGDAGFGVGPLAEDLRAVLEELDLYRAVLVGHSMGGMGVQTLACRFPEVVKERVAGLVLVGTTSHALRIWRHFATLPDGLVRGSASWFDRVILHDDFGYLLTRVGLGRRPHSSHVELVRTMLLECPLETRRLATRALMDYDVRHMLCDVDVPVLVISGTRDVLAPVAVSRRIADALPRAELQIIPGAGHMPMLEAADEVSNLIAEFAHKVSTVAGPETASSSERTSA